MVRRYRCPSCGGDQYKASTELPVQNCIYCGKPGVKSMKSLDIRDETEEPPNIKPAEIILVAPEGL